MEPFDILLDDVQEFVATADGDFRTGDPSNNYIKYILVSSPGNWKEFPLLGIGIINYINSNISRSKIERDIKVQLNADIFKNPYVNAKNFPDELIINKTVLNFEDI